MKPWYVTTSVGLTLILVSCATMPSASRSAEANPYMVETFSPVTETALSEIPEIGPADVNSTSESLQVSPERSSTTLAEISDLVERLNTIISQGRFEDWKEQLDPEYTRKFDDPVVLQEVLNGSTKLRENGVKLKNLADYFKFVVNPSRSHVLVDSIAFVDENRVEAFALLKGQKLLLYQLKLSGEQWKVSDW